MEYEYQTPNNSDVGKKYTCSYDKTCVNKDTRANAHILRLLSYPHAGKYLIKCRTKLRTERKILKKN